MKRPLRAKPVLGGGVALAGLGLGLLAGSARAADHGDVPSAGEVIRSEANITDLHVFTKRRWRETNLVVALSLDQSIPPDTASYQFASDLTVKIHVDLDSRVSFDDPEANRIYGGTIVRPKEIDADRVFTITFGPDGTPNLDDGRGRCERKARLWAGLRDDPFIRGPRQGRNVAALVLELPLDEVLWHKSTILVWATASVPNVSGPLMDSAGRSFRSMFPEFAILNQLSPAEQAHFGFVPDVVIFKTDRPAAFPNGRALEDDVLDLVGDPRPLANDAPFPSTNDVPFLRRFPYLAPPQGVPDDPGIIVGDEDCGGCGR